MLKILGVGLPRTGTASLAAALEILGLKTLHHAKDRIGLWPKDVDQDCWRAFDDIEAAVDVPVCLYWEQLLKTYPTCRVILTTRDAALWWESIKWHVNKIHQSDDLDHIRYSDELHALLFGCSYPQKYWYQRRFNEHVLTVYRQVPRHRLLVINITKGEKWEILCPFLGAKQPEANFPWENKKQDDPEAKP